MKKSLVILFLLPLLVHGKHNFDSLWTAWNDESNADTLRLQAIHRFAWSGYLFSQADSAYYFAQLERDFAKSKGLTKQQASALNTMGISHYLRSHYDTALTIYDEQLELYSSIDDEKGIANTYNNIGLVYKQRGVYDKAIEYYTKGLTIQKRMGAKKSISNILNNIGVIYKNQEEYEKALDYYEQCLEIQIELDYKKGIANAYNNIGIVKRKLDLFEEAIEYQRKSMLIKIEIQDLKGITASYDNIGLIHEDLGNIDSAIYYFELSLDLLDSLRYEKGMARPLNNLAHIYVKQEKYAKAIEFAEKSLQISQELGATAGIETSSSSLFKAYKAVGKHEKALEMHELYIEMRDSLNDLEMHKSIVNQEAQFKSEQQHIADSLDFAYKENMKALAHEAEMQEEAKQRYLLYGGLGFAVILALLALRGYRRQQRDNAIISQQKRDVEFQKEVIEVKNQEITDSIHYAKHLQNAILPPNNLIEDLLPRSFILYKPKDIVAGDFYWLETQEDGSIFFAVADCTGHGVPGAMVSVVCSNALTKAVVEERLQHPSKILDRARELIIERFDRAETVIRDGMDISLCKYDPQSKTIEWAGANNPIWVFKSNGEFAEIKGDKQPVGIFHNPQPFTNHEMKVELGDKIYIFSDGYSDQFGGEKGKKYKTNKLREKLKEIQQLDLKEQLNHLMNDFEEWKGEFEQLDDVCVLGVEIQ